MTSKLKTSYLISLFLLGIFMTSSPNLSFADSSDPLTKALLERAEESGTKISEEARAIMMRATSQLEQSGQVEKVLKVGQVIPDGSLLDSKGESSTLYQSLEGKSAIITFYRGGWCPYCNLQLHYLQEALPEIQKRGAALVAISPEKPDNSLSTTQKNELEFSVLSDAGNSYGEELGLVFQLPEDLRGVYEQFGINLEQANGDGDWELPLAATFVVDSEKKVTYRFVDVDYRKRAGIDQLLAALDAQS